MRSYLGAVFAILAKDVLLELRTKDILVTTLVFGLLVIVVFSFALDPTPTMVATVAPGILWVSFTFGGVLGLNRSFSIESSRGNLQGLMLAPVGRDAIYFGKFLSNFLLMMGVEVVIYPLFLILFNLPLVCVFDDPCAGSRDSRGGGCRHGVQRDGGQHALTGGYASAPVLPRGRSRDNRRD